MPKVLRLAVGTPDAHGPAWRVWRGGSKGDVYLGQSHTAKQIHVSLHPSGNFHCAFDQDYAETPGALRTTEDHMLEEWRPRRILPGVWHVATMLQPWFALNQTDPPPAKVTLIPPPADGNETVLSVVMVRAGHSVSGDDAIGPIELASGASYRVIVEEQAYRDARFPDAGNNGVVPDSGLRAMLTGTDQNGIGCLRDMPVQRRQRVG
jgi:hypothetical protein